MFTGSWSFTVRQGEEQQSSLDHSLEFGLEEKILPVCIYWYLFWRAILVISIPNKMGLSCATETRLHKIFTPETRLRRDWIKFLPPRRDCIKFLPPRRDRDETLQNFPHETRPRRDHPIKLERDRDETESLGALSLETETRPRLSSFTAALHCLQPPPLFN